jgi:hypothetical protein
MGVREGRGGGTELLPHLHSLMRVRMGVGEERGAKKME